MDRRYGLALPLAGLLVLAGFGVTAEGEAKRDAAPEREGMGLSVAMDDYRGVLQERAGYAFTADHFVGRNRAARTELRWWQDMVSELSGAEIPNRVVGAYWDTRQERLGYAVTHDILLDRHQGLRQELMGHQIALAHVARMQAVRKR
jgi:hypothetical protein